MPCSLCYFGSFLSLRLLALFFFFFFLCFFFFKQKTAYEIRLSLVGSEMCIRDRLQDRVSRLLELNYPVQNLSADELKRKVPEIRVGSHAGDIWYFPGECLLVPSVFMAWLVSELHVHNAELKTQSEVTELTEEKNRAEISLANGERWQGDSIVIAAGRWSAELASLLGQQLAMIDPNQPNKIACGFLGYTRPVLTQLQANLITPGLNVRPEGGGRLLLPVSYTHLRAHETKANLVCRLLLVKKKNTKMNMVVTHAQR